LLVMVCLDMRTKSIALRADEDQQLDRHREGRHCSVRTRGQTSGNMHGQ
jgi:hypothetical protein